MSYTAEKPRQITSPEYQTEESFWIVIEGPPGSGKNVLTPFLTTKLGVVQNELLAHTDYTGGSRFDVFIKQKLALSVSREVAWATELQFLVDRYLQIRRWVEKGHFRGTVISTFSLDRSLIYADVNLPGDSAKRAIFNAIVREMSDDMPKPDLVVLIDTEGLENPGEFLYNRPSGGTNGKVWERKLIPGRPAVGDSPKAKARWEWATREPTPQERTRWASYYNKLAEKYMTHFEENYPRDQLITVPVERTSFYEVCTSGMVEELTEEVKKRRSVQLGLPEEKPKPFLAT